MVLAIEDGLEDDTAVDVGDSPVICDAYMPSTPQKNSPLKGLQPSPSDLSTSAETPGSSMSSVRLGEADRREVLQEIARLRTGSLSDRVCGLRIQRAFVSLQTAYR